MRRSCASNKNIFASNSNVHGITDGFDRVNFSSEEEYNHFLEIEGMDDPLTLYENVTSTRLKVPPVAGPERPIGGVGAPEPPRVYTGFTPISGS